MFRLASERDALEGFVISLSRDDITSFVGEVCIRAWGAIPVALITHLTPVCLTSLVAVSGCILHQSCLF
jgi:hypothetical protein